MQTKTVDFQIAEHPLFRTLPSDGLKVLQDAVRRCVFPAGRVLYPAPETENGLCILQRGRASVYTALPAREEAGAFLRCMCKGAVFGVQSIYKEERAVPVTSRVQAIEECCVAVISGETFAYLLETNPGLNRAYIRFLTGRTRYLNEKISYLTAGTAEQKLCRFLILSAADSAANCHEPVQIKLDCTMRELALLLDLGRASLYRAFDALQSEGYLTRNGNDFRLPDPEKFAAHYL